MRHKLLVSAIMFECVACQSWKGQFSPKEKVEPEELTPRLTEPKIRKVWIPDRIEGDRFVKGHFVFVIERNGHWHLEGEASNDITDR